MSTDTPIKVSVLVMTFNHARYIRQAVDSVIAQRTDFAFEILITEDCSTDGTREIIATYAKQHPGVIRLLLSEQNLHSNVVIGRGLRAARGEYVAMLDGDDYWTSTLKLQTQADFLDEHPGCSLCFHNANLVDETGVRIADDWTPARHPPFSAVEDIWRGNFIAMCSTMYRRAALDGPPPWYDDQFPITDWPLHILSAQRGSIGFINEVMGAYRQHAGGYYSPWTEWQKIEATRKFYRSMRTALGPAHDRTIDTAQSIYLFEWAEEYARRGEASRSIRCLIGSLRGLYGSPEIGGRRMLRLLATLSRRRAAS